MAASRQDGSIPAMDGFEGAFAVVPSNEEFCVQDLPRKIRHWATEEGELRVR